jgi:hypothetical protein
MLCHWETVSDVWKDFLAFLYRDTLMIKATQSSEIRITEEDTSIFRNVRNYSPNDRENLSLQQQGCIYLKSRMKT